MTIIGTGFSDSSVVEFGESAATGVVVNSSTSITATSPAGTGIVDVTVTTVTGTSNTSSLDQFAYLGLTTSYTVNNSGDGYGGGSEVTLREAFDQAVAGNQIATIEFAPSLAGQTITLSMSDMSWMSVYGATGLVDNGAMITINGSGAPGLIISGGGGERLFAVTSTGSLTLENLTVSGGLAVGGNGGALGFGGGGGGGAGLGGAVYVDGGDFTAAGVTFSNNQATGGNGGTARGGGFRGAGGGGIAGAGTTSGQGGAGGGGTGGFSSSPGGVGGFGGGGGGGGAPSYTSKVGGVGGAGGVGGFGGGGGGGGRFGQSLGGTAGAAGFLGGGGGEGGSPSGSGGAGGGGAALGGAIFSNGGSITLVNDTLTGNVAHGGTGAQVGDGAGGAVFAVNGTVAATFVTFSANGALDGSDNHLDGTDLYVVTDPSNFELTGIRGTSASVRAHRRYSRSDEQRPERFRRQPRRRFHARDVGRLRPDPRQ